MSEEPAQVFTHLVAADSENYLSVPQEARAPEGTLSTGTKVTLLEEELSVAPSLLWLLYRSSGIVKGRSVNRSIVLEE